MAREREAGRIERALAGDRVAFDALFDAHLPGVWRQVTQRCDGRQAAEAWVHAVLEHAFRHLAERPAQRGLADWLAALVDELAPVGGAARAAGRAGRLSGLRRSPGSPLREAPSPTP